MWGNAACESVGCLVQQEMHHLLDVDMTQPAAERSRAAAVWDLDLEADSAVDAERQPSAADQASEVRSPPQHLLCAGCACAVLPPALLSAKPRPQVSPVVHTFFF